MRLLAAMATLLLAGLLFAAPAAAWSDEKDLRPAVVAVGGDSEGQGDGLVLLARGGHGGHGHDRFLHGGHRGHGHDRFLHGGHRGHGHDRFIHGGHRHPHHFRSHLHRHHFRHFDGHVGHFGKHRRFHPGFGISFCVRDVGVLVCFNDHTFGHRHRW